MTRLIGLTILAFLLGTVAIYAVTLFGTLIYWDLAGTHDRDGGGAMGLAFVIAPLVGVIGGVICAIVTARRLSRKKHDGEGKPMSRNARLALAVIPAGLLAYAIARFVIWIVIGNPHGSYLEVLIIAWTPTLLGVASAGLIFWFMIRQKPAQ